MMPDVNTRKSKFIELHSVDKTSSPITTTKIGGVSDMPAIPSQKETAEDTTISDKFRHREIVIGDPPSFTLTVYWDPDETPQNELRAAHEAETEDDYRVVFTDTSPDEEFEFKALITSISTPYAGVGGILQVDVGFQLNENDFGEIITENPDQA
jgi:hypothetical protein